MDNRQELTSEFLDRILHHELTAAEMDDLGLQTLGAIYRDITLNQRTSSTGDMHRMIKQHLEKMRDSST
jgi:hypothetical protein